MSSQITALFILSLSIRHRSVIAVVSACDAASQLIGLVPGITPSTLHSQEQGSLPRQVLLAVNVAQVNKNARLHGVGHEGLQQLDSNAVLSLTLQHGFQLHVGNLPKSSRLFVQSLLEILIELVHIFVLFLELDSDQSFATICHLLHSTEHFLLKR